MGHPPATAGGSDTACFLMKRQRESPQGLCVKKDARIGMTLTDRIMIFPTAVHEYVHLLIRHKELEFPVWLNEGLADLYSTLKPQGDKILVGTPPEGRMVTMLQERWVP